MLTKGEVNDMPQFSESRAYKLMNWRIYYEGNCEYYRKNQAGYVRSV